MLPMEMSPAPNWIRVGLSAEEGGVIIDEDCAMGEKKELDRLRLRAMIELANVVSVEGYTFSCSSVQYMYRPIYLKPVNYKMQQSQHSCAP